MTTMEMLNDLIDKKREISEKIVSEFKKFMEDKDIIYFHTDDYAYDEVKLMIRNSWDIDRGGDYYTIASVQHCQDGDIAVETDAEDIFYLEDLDLDAVCFLFQESITALEYQYEFSDNEE